MISLLLVLGSVSTAEASSYKSVPLELTVARQPVVMEGRIIEVACGNIVGAFPEPPPVRLAEDAATFVTFEVLDGIKGVVAGQKVKWMLAGGCGSDWIDDQKYDYAVGEVWLFSAAPNTWGVLRGASPSSMWRQRLDAAGRPITVSWEGTPVRSLLPKSAVQALVLPADKGPDLLSQIADGTPAEEMRDLFEEDPLAHALPWADMKAQLRAIVEGARVLPEWSDPGYVAPGGVL